MILKLFVIIFWFTNFVFAQSGTNIEFSKYVETGTEKYLRGNYTGALADFEVAMEMQPANQRIKELLAKVVIEGGTSYYSKQQYKQGLAFMEKGRQLLPTNSQINELYNLTQKHLSPPVDEKVISIKSEQFSKEQTRYQTPVLQKKEKLVLPGQVSSELTTLPETESVSRGASSKAEAGKKVGAILTDTYKRNMTSDDQQESLPDKTIIQADAKNIIFMGGIIVFLVIILVLFTFYYIQHLKTDLLRHQEMLRKNIEEIRTPLKVLQDQISQHSASDTELKKWQGWANAKLIQLIATIEDLGYKKNVVIPSIPTEKPPEYIVAKQCGKFLDSVEKGCLPPESFVDDFQQLRETRMQLVKQASILYEYDSQAALKTLADLSSDPRPMVQANAIWVLAEIGTPETIKMIFRFKNNPEEIVKREFIQALINLKKRPDLSEGLRLQINQTLAEEKSNQDWVF